MGELHGGSWSQAGRYCWSLPQGCQGARGAFRQGVPEDHPSTRVKKISDLRLTTKINEKRIFSFEILSFTNDIQLCTQIKLKIGVKKKKNGGKKKKKKKKKK